MSGGEFVKINYYHQYWACEEEDFCKRYILLERNWELLSGELFCWKLLSYRLTALERRNQFRSMSHLVSENKSIYFLIRFAQTKITLFIFVNNWVIREIESFLRVELCYRVTKSMGEYHVKFFESDSRLSSIYPSFALSDFHLPCRFKSLSDTPLYAASEAPPDRKLCSP